VLFRSQETRSIGVRATIDNPNEKLRAGMFAEVTAITSKASPVLTLPETAVLFNTYGESVYVVKQQDGQHSVELRNIETGAHQEGRVEIVKGLQLNDIVVNEGHVKLRNGQVVTLSNNQQ
jgi:membrane fusion protein (multidrug efflux system)